MAIEGGKNWRQRTLGRGLTSRLLPWKKVNLFLKGIKGQGLERVTDYLQRTLPATLIFGSSWREKGTGLEHWFWGFIKSLSEKSVGCNFRSIFAVGATETKIVLNEVATSPGMISEPESSQGAKDLENYSAADNSDKLLDRL